jgi:lipopolysaccharide/colanic/teichoic acid biosynthesis glycosyltransferase
MLERYFLAVFSQRTSDMSYSITASLMRAPALCHVAILPIISHQAEASIFSATRVRTQSRCRP